MTTKLWNLFSFLLISYKAYQFDINIFVSQSALCSVQQTIFIEGHKSEHNLVGARNLEILKGIQNQAALLVVRGTKDGAIGIFEIKQL